MIKDEDKELWEQFTKGIKKKKTHNFIEDDPKPRIRLPRPTLEEQSLTRLDLHGMTQEKAYQSLVSFITNAQLKGIKRVLVITGKGREPQLDDLWHFEYPGVLKREVPKWLKSLPLKDKVTQISPAKPQDGGEGAIYVYLKKL